MHSYKQDILILVVLTLLGGCSTLSPRPAMDSGAPHAAEEVSVQTPATELPRVPLSQEMLFQILEADIAVQRGQYDVAIDNYLQLARATRDPRLAEKAARVAIFTRDNTNALEASKLWVEFDPKSADARQSITVAYIRNGMPEQALEHLEQVLLSAAGEPDKGFMLVASLLSREQDLRDVLKVMKQLVASHSDNKDAYYAYSHLAMRAGAFDVAGEAIDHALLLDSEWLNAIILRSRIMQLQGKPAEAATYLAGMVKKKPKIVSLRLTYARLLVDIQRYQDALPQYEYALKQAPDNTDVLFALGLLSLQLDQLDKAEKYLTRAKDIGNRSSDAHYYLGQLEETKKNLHAAIMHYGAVNDGANYMDARTRMAILIAQQGDIEEAVSQLHILQMQIPSQRERLYLIEGELLREAEEFARALDFYTAVLEEMPDNSALLYARAITAEKLDRLDITEQDLTAILARDPDNIDALNALGYTLADRTDRYQQAYKYIKRALELKPEDSAILDSMGWVLYRLGNHMESVKYLRHSLEVRPDPEVAAHLGEVLWVIGEKDEARGVWEQALKQSPGDKILLRVMKQFVK